MIPSKLPSKLPSSAADDPARCLAPGRFVDSDHPDVRAFAEAHAAGATDRERAVALYYAVRDGFRYDPYNVDFSPRGFTGSVVLSQGHGFCVSKAALLAAAARAVGVPARVGFADVRNHLTSARLLSLMGTDVFAWHGYAELFIEGRWVKATPAFNRQLCDKVGIRPLEFDGRADSVYHPFDLQGRRHMEYVQSHGAFVDVPYETIWAAWRERYGWTSEQLIAGDFAPPPEARFEDEARGT